MLYLSKFCLLCLNSKQLERVLNLDDNGIALQEQLQYCWPEITISKSDFPEFICSSCYTTVQSFYRFRKMSLKNYNRLIQYRQTLKGRGDPRRQKFSELQIQINNLDLMLKPEQVMVSEISEINVIEKIEDPLQSLNEYIANDFVDIKQELQMNNQELLMHGEQDLDSEINIKEDIEDPLKSLEEYHRTVVDDCVGKKEFGSDSEDQEFYLEHVNVKDELTAENEHDSVSRNSCEVDNRPNVNEANFSADTHNMNETSNDTDKSEELTRKVYKCSKCNKVFLHKKSLVHHSRIHKKITNFKCFICNTQFFKQENLITHMKQHRGDKVFKCYICSKQFEKLDNLNEHIKCHAEDFKCSVCHKMFVQKENLVNHMKIHSRIKNHKCSVCDKMFVHKTSLNRHMITHSGTRDYKCIVCNKTFVLKNNLVLHMKIHEGTRNHQCSVCDKKFIRKYSLNYHMKIHSGILDYKCSFCERRFVHQGYLFHHMKTHSETRDYQCSVCDKKFLKKLYLNQHMLIHEENRNHRCSVCNKAFFHKSSLVRHMKIHEGIEEYGCTVCNLKFLSKGELEEHTRIHSDSASERA